MKKILLTVMSIISILSFGQTKPARTTTLVNKTPIPDAKFEMDKTMIKRMCGIYKVSFDFAETFSPDTAYRYHNRYNEWGIEYVFVAEESDKKIALQHLLIVNDTIIIKHWRQDWVYENVEVFGYYKDNEWLKKTLTPEQVKGTWTQKVYSVDDSPRYESFGTWLHVDGKHYWEGVNDSPLPRREYTKRSDYNVMRRHSHIEILTDGWVLEQDNEKIVRNNGVDKLLCWEKGIEKFTTGDYNATPAIKYWEKQKDYWTDVRTVWSEIYAKTPSLKIVPKIDEKRLYEKLFELGDKCCEDKSYTQGNATTEIKKIIESFLKKT